MNTEYAYDNLSRLLSVLHKLGGNTIDGTSYVVDPVGNRTAKTDLPGSVASSYAFDPIYQLTQVVKNAATTETYTYDPVGNRLSSLGVSPYSYNVSNQLTSTPTATFTYDANGNTATKTDGSGTTTYAWDYENRLSSVTLPGAGGTVAFKYDPLGRRIYKSSAAATTIFAYDGENLIEEVDSAGTAVARYSMGLNVDEPLAMLRAGSTHYYQADGLGSITSLSDSAGSLGATYTYDSFGNLVGSTGSVTNPFRYTAREWDSEMSLYFYRARYYDMFAGRFMSEDPIRFLSGVDFYTYVRNRPVTHVDPTGLFPLFACWNCLVNMYKCSKEGRACREALDEKYPDPADLCVATNSPYVSAAYAKVCFAEIPSCKAAVEQCGICGITPPFEAAAVKLSKDAPAYGPAKDRPTPVKYPPDFPGRPQNPLRDPNLPK